MLTLSHIPRLLSTSRLTRTLLRYVRERTFGEVYLHENTSGRFSVLTAECLLLLDTADQLLIARPFPVDIPEWVQHTNRGISVIADSLLVNITSSFMRKEPVHGADF